jgi:hypothetical protein
MNDFKWKKIYRSIYDEISLVSNFIFRCFISQLLYKLISLYVNVLSPSYWFRCFNISGKELIHWLSSLYMNINNCFCHIFFSIVETVNLNITLLKKDVRCTYLFHRFLGSFRFTSISEKIIGILASWNNHSCMGAASNNSLIVHYVLWLILSIDRGVMKMTNNLISLKYHGIS